MLDQIFSRFPSLSQKLCQCLFLTFLLLLCCEIGVKMLKIQTGEESQGNYVTRKPESLGIYSGECILLPYTSPEVLPSQILYLGPVFGAGFPAQRAKAQQFSVSKLLVSNFLSCSFGY